QSCQPLTALAEASEWRKKIQPMMRMRQLRLNAVHITKKSNIQASHSLYVECLATSHASRTSYSRGERDHQDLRTYRGLPRYKPRSLPGRSARHCRRIGVWQDDAAPLSF